MNRNYNYDKFDIVNNENDENKPFTKAKQLVKSLLKK